MTVNVIKNARVWVDWLDVSGQENDVRLDFQIDEKEATVFRDTAHLNAPGLEKYALAHQGFMAYGADSVDALIAELKGVSNVPVTLSIPGAAGDPCFFMRANQLSVDRGMKVGEIASFSMGMGLGAGSVVRGILLEAGSAKSTTGNGTGRQLGAASAAQKIYGVLHVLAVTGTPAITVKIQSDSDNTFGSPTDKLTFAAKTARGSEFIAPVAGPSAEQWYRASWTISGTGTATIVVAVGIM